MFIWQVYIFTVQFCRFGCTYTFKVYNFFFLLIMSNLNPFKAKMFLMSSRTFIVHSIMKVLLANICLWQVGDRSLVSFFFYSHCLFVVILRQKLTSPKWNRFKGIKLRWKDKIRLNNVIWRCWHMQCEYTLIMFVQRYLVIFRHLLLILHSVKYIIGSGNINSVWKLVVLSRYCCNTDRWFLYQWITEELLCLC